MAFRLQMLYDQLYEDMQLLLESAASKSHSAEERIQYLTRTEENAQRQLREANGAYRPVFTVFAEAI